MPRYVIVETSPAYKNRPERERVYFPKPYEEDDLETAVTVAGELQEQADRSGRPEDRYWVAALAAVQLPHSALAASWGDQPGPYTVHLPSDPDGPPLEVIVRGDGGEQRASVVQPGQEFEVPFGPGDRATYADVRAGMITRPAGVPA
jgi:hypothetical protein